MERVFEADLHQVVDSSEGQRFEDRAEEISREDIARHTERVFRLFMAGGLVVFALVLLLILLRWKFQAPV